jgi:hypothetical protein
VKQDQLQPDLRVCASGEPKYGLKDPASRISGRSAKTRNVLSMIESQGFRIQRASAPGYLKLMPSPSGNAHRRLKDTSSRNPDSSGERTAGRFCCNRHYPIAVGCRTGLVSKYAADQNNSNLTPHVTSVASGGWELLFVNSSHYCFTVQPPHSLQTL